MTAKDHEQDPQQVEKETLKDLEATDDEDVKGGNHPTHLGCIETAAPPSIITHNE